MHFPVLLLHCGPSDNCMRVVQLSLLTYGAEMFKGDACPTARMIASKTCTEVYRRMKQLMPNLPAAVPGSPLAGTKRKGNAPQKRKNATQVMDLACLKVRSYSFCD